MVIVMVIVREKKTSSLIREVSHEQKIREGISPK